MTIQPPSPFGKNYRFHGSEVGTPIRKIGPKIPRPKPLYLKTFGMLLLQQATRVGVFPFGDGPCRKTSISRGSLLSSAVPLADFTIAHQRSRLSAEFHAAPHLGNSPADAFIRLRNGQRGIILFSASFFRQQDFAAAPGMPGMVELWVLSGEVDVVFPRARTYNLFPENNWDMTLETRFWPQRTDPLAMGASPAVVKNCHAGPRIRLVPFQIIVRTSLGKFQEGKKIIIGDAPLLLI